MRVYFKSLSYTRSLLFYLPCLSLRRTAHHRAPIMDLYFQTTGHTIDENYLPTLIRKHPNIDKLNTERLHCTLQILQKFGVTAFDACNNLHVFSMNPITMDNYGEILKECRFISINAKHIIKYHTIAKTKSIATLKKEGLMSDDVDLEQVLLDCFNEWPVGKKTLQNFSDVTATLLTIRTSVLERYLKWRLSITTEDFQKYCRNYLPLRHKPMSDIQEALDLAENDIKFDKALIRRNGFIISSDPLNTKLILENVPSLAGLDIREAIKIEPAILKNNYSALLQIRDILESYRIPLNAQAVCLKVYCMRSETVKERLEELSQLKEFKILSTNPRVLSLVVHKKKFVNRLSKIQAAKKQCYSLNHLISSSKVFSNYITSFGSKVCGRDIVALMTSSLEVKATVNNDVPKAILGQLKRQKYWLHVALSVIDENIQYLKKKFDDRVILNNCQLLLYPMSRLMKSKRQPQNVNIQNLENFRLENFASLDETYNRSEIEQYMDIVIKIRRGERDNVETSAQIDLNYYNLRRDALTDDQLLSLVLYEIEKKYHFSGDGIWSQLDGAKQSIG